ncbi:transcriptional regulator [Pedobacter sp. KBW06]|nr:transcriptional regulator [Pedobacter sp. KBW06]
MKEQFYSRYHKIGRNVKTLRLKHKWTQLQLANKCDIDWEQIDRIENARQDYLLSTLLKVRVIFHIDVITVMTEDL